MALKIVNTESLDAVADAINEKAGTSGKLTFPDGFVGAIKRISAGGGDGFTLQDFIDKHNLTNLYRQDGGNSYADADMAWLADADTSRCTNADYMFYGCRDYGFKNPPLFDTSNVTSMKYMLSSAHSSAGHFADINIPLYNTQNVTDISCMFYGARLSQTSLENISKFNLEKVTKAESVFQYSWILSAPITSLPNAKTVKGLYTYCRSLTSVGTLSFPKATDADTLFNYCTNLTSADCISVPSATNIYAMFQKCEKLKFVNRIETHISTSKNISANTMFSDCLALETVGYIDMRLVTGTTSMFYNCKALTNLTLKNIYRNLQVGSGTSYGHLLTVNSLVGLCYELRDTGSLKTLTVGNANLEKLANVYVRSIEITDAMRAEDDLIDEKLPFERCESTDEGATLIGDYVILKNWKLA